MVGCHVSIRKQARYAVNMRPKFDKCYILTYKFINL